MRDVELEIATDGDARGVGTDSDDAARVFFGLHQEEVDMRKDGTHRAAPEMIAGEGAVGDSAVDDGYGGAGAACLTEKVRPELRLGDEDDCRLNGTKGATASESEVERKIESPVGSEFRAGKGLAGFGGRADKDATSGEAASQQGNERSNGLGFTDRNGMNPESSNGRL